MPLERLDKLISGRLCISRKEARQKIKEGRVLLLGKALLNAEQKLEPGTQGLTADGAPVMTQSHVYIMMNKPAGVLSASRDGKVKTVIDLVPQEYRIKGLFPAGRLDKDTTGLMLITNDGELAHRLLSPKNRVAKVYRAVLDGPVDESMIKAFAEGIELKDGTKFLPARLRNPPCRCDDIPPLTRGALGMPSPASLAKGRGTAVAVVGFGGFPAGQEGFHEAEITVFEGKYHQIKRMFRACGREVLRLRRLRIGSLPLDPDLAPGECKLLGSEELQLLLKNSVENCI